MNLRRRRSISVGVVEPSVEVIERRNRLVETRAVETLDETFVIGMSEESDR